MHTEWLAELDKLKRATNEESRSKIAALYYLYPENITGKAQLRGEFSRLNSLPLDTLLARDIPPFLNYKIRDELLNQIGSYMSQEAISARPGFAIIYMNRAVLAGMRPSDIRDYARKFRTEHAIDKYMAENFRGAIKQTGGIDYNATVNRALKVESIGHEPSI